MPAEEVNTTKEWELADYLDLVSRRKAVIIAIFTLVFLATVIYTFTRTPVYGSFSSFLIDESANTSGVGTERYNPYAYWMKQGKPVEYYQAIIGSQVYMDKVLKRVNEDEDVRISGATEEDISAAVYGVGLSMDENSSLMTLSTRAYSPLLAFKSAQCATEVFKERIQEIDVESAQDIVSYIDKQRQEAQQRLEEAERALQQYSGAGEMLFIGEDGGMMSKISQVESMLEQAETERRLAESNLASFNMQLQGAGKPNSDLQSIESVPEIAKLRGQLTKLEDQRNALTVTTSGDSVNVSELDGRIEATKNELRRLILAHSTKSLPAEDKRGDDLRSMLTQRLVAEQVNLSSTRNKERFYNNLLDEYRRQSPERLEKVMELAKLRRTQAVHQNLLNYLVERHEEAKIKAATGAGGIRIVNPAALPEQPISRNKPRTLLIGIMLGLGLGFGLAMLQEYLDQTVRTKQDLERLTGIQVVGQIPMGVKMNGNNGHAGKKSSGLKAIWNKHVKHRMSITTESLYYPLINKYDPHSPFVESFRSLRTDLQFYRIDNPLKKMLITSSIPGEGKTLVTANLALAYAELGHKVAILDADIRKPKQPTVFGVDRVPGFTDYFMDLVPYEKIVRKLPVRNLTLIPSGTIPPNPTEVLNSQKMADLIDRLEQEYDYILVDAPPMLTISDAKTISRLVDNILLVFRFAQTEKRYVSEVANSLRVSKSHVIGFVLNGVDYGNGKGYYKYLYYYDYREKPDKVRVDVAQVN